MKIFTTLDGDSIDLESVFAISRLLFDWCSDYGIYSHEKGWYAQLGIKGKEQLLKFSLGCASTVDRTDSYDRAQVKRRGCAAKAEKEYRRLMTEWTNSHRMKRPFHRSDNTM